MRRTARGNAFFSKKTLVPTLMAAGAVSLLAYLHHKSKGAASPTLVHRSGMAGYGATNLDGLGCACDDATDQGLSCVDPMAYDTLGSLGFGEGMQKDQDLMGIDGGLGRFHIHNPFKAVAKAVTKVVQKVATIPKAIPKLVSTVAKDATSVAGGLLLPTILGPVALLANAGKILGGGGGGDAGDSGAETAAQAQADATAAQQAATAAATGVATATSPPVITSPTVDTANLNQPFFLQVTTNTVPPVTAYAAQGLPSGLAIDPVGGFISGTPLVAGNFPVTLQAQNSNGVGSEVVQIQVVDQAAISANAQPNVDLSYGGATDYGGMDDSDIENSMQDASSGDDYADDGSGDFTDNSGDTDTSGDGSDGYGDATDSSDNSAYAVQSGSYGAPDGSGDYGQPMPAPEGGNVSNQNQLMQGPDNGGGNYYQAPQGIQPYQGPVQVADSTTSLPDQDGIVMEDNTNSYYGYGQSFDDSDDDGSDGSTYDDSGDDGDDSQFVDNTYYDSATNGQTGMPVSTPAQTTGPNGVAPVNPAMQAAISAGQQGLTGLGAYRQSPRRIVRSGNRRATQKKNTTPTYRLNGLGEIVRFSPPQQGLPGLRITRRSRLGSVITNAGKKLYLADAKGVKSPLIRKLVADKSTGKLYAFKGGGLQGIGHIDDIAQGDDGSRYFQWIPDDLTGSEQINNNLGYPQGKLGSIPGWNHLEHTRTFQVLRHETIRALPYVAIVGLAVGTVLTAGALAPALIAGTSGAIALTGQAATDYGDHKAAEADAMQQANAGMETIDTSGDLAPIDGPADGELPGGDTPNQYQGDGVDADFLNLDSVFGQGNKPQLTHSSET